ncbi:beta-ketoacyl-[acyl-carrier-protein] synthase family protein [Streptosporangium saharense]|uniref:3-oxoacyl-[acyl-carrier-protein] synthase 2 n=1 Tax=Streptosporangium saharense TaxID=1706840 RepID=A0A7W7VMI3_9ACTN|nr:beta-ketoacyl-ACP synthase II [Streptosporangium saharense]MBB4915643.1 3-oxoacyl-[acyl-carrier-protein] synthase II [Streptosporangium saharense]
MGNGHEVVITGIGAVTPVGIGREETWRNLLAGRSGVGPVTAFDASALPTRIAAEVRGFDPAAYLDAKRVRRSARFSQFAVAAAREAVADAKLEIGQDNAARIGVVVNAAVAGFDTVETATRGLLDPSGPVTPNSYFVPSSLTNMPACETAIDLGAHGPVNASALACASGLYALLDARRLILAGEADAVVCGGTDAAITPVMFAGLVGMGAMSERNDDPQGASRPFSADRDGFVFGEGAVIMVVESAEHAARRGVTPYAAIAGGALTCDAFHISAPDPYGGHAAEAIGQALRRAGVQPGDLDYVCAHGTSTAANDVTETRAIRAALGPAADRVAVSAPKSMVGHLIGAAGSLGAMVCAMAIRDGTVPPTINLEVPDPACDLDYVPGVARRTGVRVAATNAFGFGGQNCVAVFSALE